ncbi:MAG: phage morphogenesis protein [Rhodobacteraceae bacterium]|nr:phage morphogenesis protein [Paracoccaceae bacterium]
MAVTLKVRFDDAAPQAALARAAFGARDLSQLMDLIGTVLVNGAVERIGQTNVAPDGTPWPKSLRAQLDDGITLHDSGQLMRSITHEAASDQVEVGSNMIYAGIHQTGGTIKAKNGKALAFTLANGESAIVGSVKIPARPYLGISDEERMQAEEVSVQYFADLLDAELR